MRAALKIAPWLLAALGIVIVLGVGVGLVAGGLREVEAPRFPEPMGSVLALVEAGDLAGAHDALRVHKSSGGLEAAEAFYIEGQIAHRRGRALQAMRLFRRAVREAPERFAGSVALLEAAKGALQGPDCMAAAEAVRTLGLLELSEAQALIELSARDQAERPSPPLCGMGAALIEARGGPAVTPALPSVQGVEAPRAARENPTQSLDHHP